MKIDTATFEVNMTNHSHQISGKSIFNDKSLHGRKVFHILFKEKYTCFFKQLGSRLSPQKCIYFQGFWDSKFLNGCLVV